MQKRFISIADKLILHLFCIKPLSYGLELKPLCVAGSHMTDIQL